MSKITIEILTISHVIDISNNKHKNQYLAVRSSKYSRYKSIQNGDKTTNNYSIVNGKNLTLKSILTTENNMIMLSNHHQRWKT